MKIAKPLAALINSFHKLPGIGPKTAQRLTYYLLHVPTSEINSFAEALTNLKKDTVLCSTCKNVNEKDPCEICSDKTRDSSTILVVEQPLDILAFEKTSRFKGLYHVLHGSISPLENIGPDELYIEELLRRIKKGLKEVIIATNPTMEGEATAMYLAKKLKMNNPLRGKSEKSVTGAAVKVTRLGMGVPTGADLEYADETTLISAIQGRREL